MREREVAARGALVGWRREESAHGCILVLQVAASAKGFDQRDFKLVELALNDRQLRSLARDLTRAAEERGIELRPKRARWKFW